MKKLKSNQLGHWCSYCPDKSTRAVYRVQYTGTNKHCCNEHKSNALVDEHNARQCNDHLTEADYQTWMNL